MAFGVLEPSTTSRPSGTSLLENVTSDAKHEGEVILVPRPSASRADPLNMSRFRKELYFFTIILGACATGVIGPVLAPGFSIVGKDFGIAGLEPLVLLNGSLVMALGVSAYVCSPLAVVYGKRLVYIVTTIILIISCIWAAASPSYKSLLAARIFQGIGIGAYFSLAGTASINDVFFVHERGFRVGLWNFSLIVAVNIAPVISGNVIVSLGWRWCFWLLTILYGILLGMIILGSPETTFHREIVTASSSESLSQETTEKVPSQAQVEVEALPSDVWLRYGLGTLKIEHQSRVFKTILRPLGLLRHPSVIWTCAMWTVMFMWAILLGTMGDSMFQAPPYNMSATSVGNLIGIAPMIGSAIGTLAAGWMSDWLSQKLALRNHGIYEPEFRLLIIIPALIFNVIGSFGLGAALHNGLSPITCAVFLAFINVAVGFACTGIVAYTNDVCGDRTGDAFGLAMLCKSAFVFGLTFMWTNFYSTRGPLIFYCTWGGLSTGVLLTTIPMYIYGKKVRSWADSLKLL